MLGTGKKKLAPNLLGNVTENNCVYQTYLKPGHQMSQYVKESTGTYKDDWFFTYISFQNPDGPEGMAETVI
jgi:hypothetical protein